MASTTIHSSRDSVSSIFLLCGNRHSYEPFLVAAQLHRDDVESLGFDDRYVSCMQWPNSVSLTVPSSQPRHTQLPSGVVRELEDAPVTKSH